MAMIADILLGAGAIGAALYCLVLSRRLARFTQLETGMGGAIAVLSSQVDDMTRALKGARETAGASASALEELTMRAEKSAARLEIILATMHDLPNPATPAATPAVKNPENAPTRKLRILRSRLRHDQLETAE